MEGHTLSHEGTVDPEVRAFVTSLVTAIGGTGSYEDGRYVLGDDALACLRDLKRWLRLYDEKLNRLDVARVLAERNLVKGDLLEILATWPEEATEDRIKAKVALACFELLVPLTWPLDKAEEHASANFYRNFPYLQLAQISYKREILEHPSAGILRTAVRAALPSLALAADERTQRDEGIIKLILYFLRNVTMITAPANLSVEWNENEVSRSATIEAFHKQDIFALLLTVASNIGEEFGNQDTVLLEILFHLFKGVDVTKLFMNEVELEAKHSTELKDEMLREASMRRSHAKNAPTRHNRFGTMIWVKRDEGRGVSCVSGQDVLSDAQMALKKMDQSKRYSRPTRRSKEDVSSNSFGRLTPLTNSATQHLRAFVEDLLDSGFNPLMYQLRRAIEREADRVLEIHSHQFFYLVAWCLEAERARRKSQRDADARTGVTAEADSFSLVASVLNQETFILLNRYMEDRLEHKLWLDLNAGMRSFIQILLTVQEMAESPLDEDQEIADNIQNRIFYEETTHDRIIAIVKGFKDQGFSYLDACTELTHVFLRLLERYSRQNLDLQVRSRRRAQRKRKKDAQSGQDENTAAADSENEEIAEAQKVSRERKFDFNRFAAKFVTQSCVDTFAALLAFYEDLTTDQLKRVHRFFYRVAFKQEMSVILFRMDIIHLLHQMIKGSNKLDQSSPMFGEWEEFSKQLFRRLIKKMRERPALAVELLFSKINATAYYLEYGYEKQTTTSRPRAPAELEVKGSLSIAEQIGVVVAALHEEQMSVIEFVEKTLQTAADERQSWEAQAEARRQAGEGEMGEETAAPSIAIRATTDDLRIGLFKNNKFRLLLNLTGCERLGENDDPDGRWIIPSHLSSEQLRATAALITSHRTDPKLNYAANPEDEPIQAEQLLRRKPAAAAARKSGVDWGDSDDNVSFLADDEEPLFPISGPTPRAPDALAELKAARRERKRRDSHGSDADDDDGLDAAMRQARRRARRLADLQKRRQIKSAEFVRFSDDESDASSDARFFEAEEQRRRDQAQQVHAALVARRDASSVTAANPAGAQPASNLSDANDSDDSDASGATKSRKRVRRMSDAASDDDANGDDEADTPPSSQSPRSATEMPKRPRLHAAADRDAPATEPLDSATDNESAVHEPATLPLRKLGAYVPMLDADGETGTGADSDASARVRARPGRRRVGVLEDSDDE